MSLAKNYNFLDKTLHHLAFGVPGLGNMMADLESSLFKKELTGIESKNEVFVSGLPRSGTTLLLELLYKTDEFSTFSYRHMPFIFSPLLWKKISKPFSKSAEKVERAHGDGMEVSFDSPEAFEEVIWLTNLKEKFVKQDRLIPLTPQNTTKKFAVNMQNTLKKLLLETADGNDVKRYISKNNANCSRVSVLTKLFPTATILIPFREPLGHIGSLMKQHQQFLEMHKDDEFSKKYMRWLGHYDFGENFKPIDFDQWLSSIEGEIDYQDENFWLQYWIAAYTNILNNPHPNVHLVDFDKLLQSPAETLQAVADQVVLQAPQKLVDCAKEIRTPTSKAKSSEAITADIMAKANQLHSSLKQAAL